MSERRLRRHDRLVEKVPIQIMWKDRNGNDLFLTGQTVDVSEEGLRLELRDRIDEGTSVNFRAEALKLHGTATVRRCSRQGTKFLIGLHFTGGLRWKTEAAAKEPEPAPEEPEADSQ